MTSAAPVTLQGVKVLVVDDDEGAVQPVCIYLRMQGADVRFAGSAMDGLSVVPEFRPDAVVADVSMPEVDGYSFLARLRALPSDAGGLTPALALSAVAFPEHQEWALRAGFQRFLAKPVRPNVVAEAIADVLRTPIA